MRKGTQHSEETKAKISAAKTGKLFTDEHSQKIADALKGKKKTKAHRNAISAGIRAAHAAKKAQQQTPEFHYNPEATTESTLTPETNA